MEASITFKSVGKKYNNETLLADLSFGIEKNTKFALIGPNGSGKSTILKLVSGLVYKDKGSIYLKGHDVSIKSHQIKSILGYMPQKIDLDPDLTIYNNILFYAQLHGMGSFIAKENIISILNSLKIIDYIDFYPNNLNFSINRLAMFARAIVHNPEVVLLDEPTMSLDPIYRDIIWEYIYNEFNDKTLFYTTQNFKEAEQNSDRIAILYDGVIKYNGSFDYLVKNTYGLAKFSISFESKIPEFIKKSILLNTKIISPNFSDDKLIFYSTDKFEFYKILKDAFTAEINDINSSKCTLEDIFKRISQGEE